MKIEATRGVIVTLDPQTKQKVEHNPGEPFDLDDKEAAFLISQGLAEKAVGGNTNRTAEEKAAGKRKALEEKAFEPKVGTAKEIKALSDDELAAKIEAAHRQELVNKAVEAKLGTAEEVGKLSDKDLKELLKTGGAK